MIARHINATILKNVVLFLACIFLAVAPTNADERIKSYDVAIVVEPSGDLLIEETIRVNVEGLNIRRGIFRDLPIRSSNKKTHYDVESVYRDGEPENYQTEREGNAFRIRIGSANHLLDHRVHEYAIRYRVKKQILFSKGRDELYWNVTGSYWDFAIDKVTARVALPDGAHVQDASAYTGGYGSTGGQARYYSDRTDHMFQTTTALPSKSGMTISLSFDEGTVQRPSLFSQLISSLLRSLPLFIFGVGSMAIWRWLHKSYLKVGVDPAKYPVTVEFSPPEGISAAAAAFIVARSKPSNTMLMAALLQLGIGKAIRLDVKSKKSVTLLKGTESTKGLLTGAAEDVLLSKLFAERSKILLDGSYDSKFTSAYSGFSSKMKRRYGSYFKWNHGYLVSAVFYGIGLSILAIFAMGMMNAPAKHTTYVTLGCVGLVALYSIYAYLLPAPTKKGYRLRNHLLGFKEYLETAEAQYLNMADVDLKAPPVMSAELYERFLPYAVALGVEKPWSKYFKTVMPTEAEAFQSAWTDSRHWNSFGDLRSALPALSSSLGAARVAPSSSSSGGSGFSGGGFSGGGGGGGGGGGW